MSQARGTSAPAQLDIDALVRSVVLNAGTPAMLFLGAGASITSGIPSAESCIWDWKRRLFVSTYPPLSDHVVDTSIDSVRNRIQGWADQQARFPAAGAEDEYAFYAEECFALPEDRRQYFQQVSAGRQPFKGYRLLALLAEAGVIRGVWTTNFDGLAARAAHTRKVVVIEAGLDTPHRIHRQPRPGEFQSIALHGDYRYDSLKNLPTELAAQDAGLRDALIDSVRDTTLIVIGYSGRDRSIMETLRTAYSQPGTGRLYWCSHGTATPPASVQELIDTGQAAGRDAYYIPSDGFDDIMTRLATSALQGPPRDEAAAIIAETAGRPGQVPRSFRVSKGPTTTLIKSNAFAIDSLPAELAQFDAPTLFGPDLRQRLRELTKPNGVVAAPFHRTIIALGAPGAVKAAFASVLEGEVSVREISEQDLRREEGAVTGVLGTALTQSIAQACDLVLVSPRVVRLPVPSGRERHLGDEYRVFDALEVRLRRYTDSDYLVVTPTIEALTSSGDRASREAQFEIRSRLLRRQHNREFNNALNDWRRRLFPGDRRRSFGHEAWGEPGTFTIRSVPVLVSVHQPANTPVKPSPAVATWVRLRGSEHAEPPVLFDGPDGAGAARDVHPIRGLLENRPYDYPLTASGIAGPIHVGVVCPAKDSTRLDRFLSQLHLPQVPNTKQDYLLPYPGCSAAFHVPFVIARPGSADWVEVPEPELLEPSLERSLKLASELGAAVSRAAAANASPIVVFVPQRWGPLEAHRTETDRFNLHHTLKAYAAPLGIATQLLREDTLDKPQMCEVAWWLSLAFYTKAQRTPWVVEGLNPDTAFMGLGFSVDPVAEPGRRVVNGCSHLYGPSGLGLRYRLRRIESPVIRRGRPHMSLQDARRTGRAARELFFESMMRLPDRVVVHKQTPFLPDERQGLLEGLGDVPSVDMIEVRREPGLRCTAARSAGDGEFESDFFPVRRGTSVVVGPHQAIVWLHGATDSTASGRRYYLGNNRIPTPVTVIRHHGESELDTIVAEVLGLSKMNWNSFDMYSLRPATIQSSNQIAAIGALLPSAPGVSYDYRLLM